MPAAIEQLESRVHLARPDPSPAENVYFRLPLSSDTTTHFYYDRNESAPGSLAWNGTSQSYDGHTGTDFSGGPRGRPVYAAAPGILIGKDDGHPDQGGPANGNYVRINHGNNRLGQSIRTVYLHFNAGTVTTKAIGSFIAAGEQIGGVGTSGNSTGLHLHFHTMVGGAAFDPYKGVGTSETSWWVNQGSGSPSTTAQPGKLNVGDTAQVYELTGSDPLNVRGPNPTSPIIGTRGNGDTGVVLAGPVWAALNNDISNNLWVWYKLRWSSGLEGWSVQNWLRAAPDTTAPSIVGSAFDNDRSPHKVTIDFTENVSASLSPVDATLRNVATGETFSTTVSFDGAQNRATFAFGGTLSDGNYELTLHAAGVTDAAGNGLATDHRIEFFHLTADANRDRTVNLADFATLGARFNTPGTHSTGDYNYNGQVEIGDFSLLASRFNTSLPSPSRNVFASGRREKIDPQMTQISRLLFESGLFQSVKSVQAVDVFS
jgi:hypothetical protein